MFTSAVRPPLALLIFKKHCTQEVHWSPRVAPPATAPAQRSHASTRRAAAAERARAAAMAFSQLSGDEQGVILGQLRDTLEPSLEVPELDRQ